jgi:hypothetical protein
MWPFTQLSDFIVAKMIGLDSTLIYNFAFGRDPKFGTMFGTLGRGEREKSDLKC